jgi:hypothetical protein
LISRETNKCLVSKCDPIKGLVQTPLVCAATDKCTKSFCCPNRGCVAQPVVCDTPPGGAIYKCNPSSGVCECVRPPCDDSDPCTIDSYVDGKGCVNSFKCQSNNLCVVPKCDKSTGSCSYAEKNCDDGNPCTIDSCDPVLGKCINTPKTCTCTAGNLASCNTTTGQCEYKPTCRTHTDCPNGFCDPARGCQRE